MKPRRPSEDKTETTEVPFPKNTDWSSATCPSCGAPVHVEIREVPALGPVEIERRYKCGNRVRCRLLLAAVTTNARCRGAKRRKASPRRSR